MSKATRNHALIVAALLVAGCAGPRARWNGSGQKPGSQPISYGTGRAPPAFLPVPRIASF